MSLRWENRSTFVCDLLTRWCENGRLPCSNPRAEAAQLSQIAKLLARISENDRKQFFARFREGRTRTDLRQRTWDIIQQKEAA